MFPAGWPGQSFCSYMLGLAFVFLVSFTVEWLSQARLTKSNPNNIIAGLQQTFMYGVRVALAYIVMLAVMSFSVGVFSAAVAGYTVGFMIFGSRFFRGPKVESHGDLSDLPPLNC